MQFSELTQVLGQKILIAIVSEVLKMLELQTQFHQIWKFALRKFFVTIFIANIQHQIFHVWKDALTIFNFGDTFHMFKKLTVTKIFHFFHLIQIKM